MNKFIILLLLFLTILQFTQQACSSKCGSCKSGSETECSSCITPNNRYKVEENVYCDCKPTYYHYLATRTCVDCPGQCKKCNDEVKGQPIECTECNVLRINKLPLCEECVENATEANGECSCNASYKPNEKQTACISKGCALKCFDCDAGDVSNCITCRSDANDTNRNTISQTNKCDCLPQYFDDPNDGPNCKLCDLKCAECETNTKKCISCQDKLKKLNTLDDELTCTKCIDNAKENTLNNCECINNFYLENYECKSCGDNCVDCDKTNGCTKCKASFYPKDKTCSPCSNNCDECESSTKCTKCSVKYFITGTDPNISCSKCDDLCAKCNTTKDNCTECVDNKKKSPGCTECKETFYKSGQECLKCLYPCQNCSDATTCTSCQDPDERNNDCTCKDGYYTDNLKKCQACIYPCATCSSSTECKTCKTTENRANTTDCNCKKGFFDNKSKCDNCDTTKCVSCKDSSNNCTECVRYRTNSIGKTNCDICIQGAEKNSQGVSSCSTGYFSILKNSIYECNLCLVKCDSCKNTQDNCTQCASDRKHITNDSNCVCLSGTYDPGNNQKCKDCEYPCQNCTNSAKNCTSCQTPSNRNNNSSCDCEPGYYETGSICAKCSDFCATCVDNKDKCLSCAQYRQYTPHCSFCVKGTFSYNGKCQLETVYVYDPLGTEKEKISRCMSAVVIGGTQNCQMCRADKDQNGKIISQGLTSETEGTFSLRKNLDVFYCNDKSNENDTKETYDQENKVPFCEIYDHFGLCRRCLVRYGLQWQYQDEKGFYKCLPNENSVPFCHEYDQNGKCIECKWNQNDDEKDLYPNQKQEYLLDYALYTYNNKQFCINNRKHDIVIRDLDEKFLLTHIRSNCAEYNSSQKCIRCHTRKYDYEGNVQWEQYFSRTGSFYESQDYLLSDDGDKCVNYPKRYITKPEQLKTIIFYESTNTDSLDGTKSKCKDQFQLYPEYQTILPRNYGCGPIIENCNEAQFNWDYENFQKTGLWHKKFIKCTQCKDNYLTNGEKCVAASGSSLQNCELVVIGSDKNECILKTSIKVFDYSANCQQQYEFTRDKNNEIIIKCTLCDFGYVPTDEGKCSFVQDLDKRGCSRKDKQTDGTCTSTTQYGWNSEGLCQNGIVRNIEQLCYSSKGLKIIENCEIYINTHDQSRCHKCKDSFNRSPSQDQCLPEPSNSTEGNTIERCVQMDGPWCQRCQRDIKQDEDTYIHYILTDQNTCILNNMQNNSQCIYAKYNSNSISRTLTTCIQCNSCYTLDSNGYCVVDTDCQNVENAIYLYTDIERQVSGDQVDNCILYRDNYGNCYQCNRIGNKNYGVYTNPTNNKKECKECTSGQVLERGVNGEYICVTEVKNCVQYHENDYCVACQKNSYLQISEDGNSLQCIDQSDCTLAQAVLEANSRTVVCLRKDVKEDPKCKTVEVITANNYRHYEFYNKQGGGIGLRCGTCDDGYYIDTQGSNLCISKSEITNFDTKFQYSRLFQGIKSDTPTIVKSNQNNFMNTPCIYDYDSINMDQENIYIESLGYCRPYQIGGYYIKNCKIQNSNSGEAIACNQCYEGFILNHDKTECRRTAANPFFKKSTNSKLKECLYSESNSSSCQFCRYGYSLYSTSLSLYNSCTQTTSLGCIDYSNDCKVCQNPFIRVKKGESSYFCQLKMKGCLKQSIYNECAECLPGYQYDTISAQCLRRTQNCYDQDFTISYDYIETKTMRGDVCKGCFQNEDQLRLYYVSEGENVQKLVKSCVYGCEQLRRKINVRSPSHPFNIWECDSCRNNEYHINNSLGDKWCVKADKISNCQLFQQKVENFEEICILCKDGYYLNKSGRECTLCEGGLVPNCEQQDNQATSIVNNQCKCQKCSPTYFVTSTGECKKSTGDVANCDAYDNSGKCLKCKDENKGIRFLNTEGKCQDYSKDLNCGGTNGSNHSKKEDKCLRCDHSTTNRLLNSQGKCTVGNIKNCLIYENSTTCQQCEINYGLNYEKTECLDNKKQKMQNNCFRYNNQSIDGYLTCYECITGYAIDYNFYDNQTEQCVQINYCQKGYKISDGQVYCKECKIFDYEDNDINKGLKRIFRTNIPSVIEATCSFQISGDLTLVQHCKYYQVFTTNNKQCWKCHDGYNSDYNQIDKQGTQCVSDAHPGALPGCSNYKIFNDGDNYQKYEDLICGQCYKYYRFHQDSELLTFSRNTYSNSCVIKQQTVITVPSSNLWTGKDGGLRNRSQDNDNDQDPVIIDDNGREFYEDPVLDISSKLEFLILNCLILGFFLII